MVRRSASLVACSGRTSLSGFVGCDAGNNNQENGGEYCSSSCSSSPCRRSYVYSMWSSYSIVRVMTRETKVANEREGV